MKNVLSKVANWLRLYEISYKVLGKTYKNKYIRVINYHGTLDNFQENFEKQLLFYKRYYRPVDYNTLSNFIKNKQYPYDKPGILLTFDDGLESNFLVAAPLLEKHGIQGWFFICPGFVDLDTGDENKEKYMSWDQVRELDQKHVIGCHTMTHRRLVKNIPKAILENEIIKSKKILEGEVGHNISTFCWVGGEKNTYTKNAARVINNAGYEFSFMTNSMVVSLKTNALQIQRTNIESDWELNRVKVYLSGIADLYYQKKRKYVEKITKI